MKFFLFFFYFYFLYQAHPLFVFSCKFFQCFCHSCIKNCSQLETEYSLLPAFISFMLWTFKFAHSAVAAHILFRRSPSLLFLFYLVDWLQPSSWLVKRDCSAYILTSFFGHFYIWFDLISFSTPCFGLYPTTKDRFSNPPSRGSNRNLSLTSNKYASNKDTHFC